MAKKLIIRKAKPVEEEKKLEMPAQGKGTGGTNIGVQKVWQLRVDMIISHGGEYEGESHEEVLEKLRNFVKDTWPNANFTPTGGYYLIESVLTGHREVCTPSDFDFATMTRKPGTRPPSWSQNTEMAASIDREYRVIEESHNPNHLVRNAANLYTTKEIDRKNAAKKKLDEVKSVSEKIADKKLDQIAAERPDLIQRPVVKKAVASSAPKKLVVKK